MVELSIESFGLLAFVCGLCVGITAVLVSQSFVGGKK